MPLPLGWIADITDSSVTFALPDVSSLSDTELLTGQRDLAETSRRTSTAASAFAAEIAVRSRRELGNAGLAQRLGARTPERLVQTLTGSTAR